MGDDVIKFEQPFLCRAPWTCPGVMMPSDILTGGDRWQPYLIVVILECPICHETKRWQCYVDDSGDILVGVKRAYADHRSFVWRD